jgi:hypothetical protein
MSARPPKQVCCAIYTRVSTDQGLEQDYNSLDAQRDASQAYIRSQAHAGWTQVRTTMTTVGSPVATPIARRCSDCWRTSGLARSMSSLCTRSTG